MALRLTPLRHLERLFQHAGPSTYLRPDNLVLRKLCKPLPGADRRSLSTRLGPTESCSCRQSRQRILHSSSGRATNVVILSKRHNSSSSSRTSLSRAEAQSQAQKRLRPLLDDLPSGIDWAVAYGSGVINQANTSTSGPAPMTDLLISVSDPLSFHQQNLLKNPSHYPLWARVTGANSVVKVQEEYGAGIWYVTMVQLGGVEVKYGVISTKRLVSDLKNWDTMYIAGRLQKPVLTLISDASVHEAQEENLDSAFALALLQLPHQNPFTEYELWEQITGISYSGDPRMSVPGAENPQKVKNIVRGDGNLQGFRELYAPFIKKGHNLAWSDGAEQGEKWEWRGQGEAKLNHIEDRRLELTRGLWTKLKFGSEPNDEAIKELLLNQRYRKTLSLQLNNIIYRPALTQSMKGLITAGFTKSFRYSMAKVRKWFKARQSQK